MRNQRNIKNFIDLLYFTQLIGTSQSTFPVKTAIGFFANEIEISNPLQNLHISKNEEANKLFGSKDMDSGLQPLQDVEAIGEDKNLYEETQLSKDICFDDIAGFTLHDITIQHEGEKRIDHEIILSFEAMYKKIFDHKSNFYLQLVELDFVEKNFKKVLTDIKTEILEEIYCCYEGNPRDIVRKLRQISNTISLDEENKIIQNFSDDLSACLNNKNRIEIFEKCGSIFTLLADFYFIKEVMTLCYYMNNKYFLHDYLIMHANSDNLNHFHFLHKKLHEPKPKCNLLKVLRKNIVKEIKKTDGEVSNKLMIYPINKLGVSVINYCVKNLQPHISYIDDLTNTLSKIEPLYEYHQGFNEDVNFNYKNILFSILRYQSFLKKFQTGTKPRNLLILNIDPCYFMLEQLFIEGEERIFQINETLVSTFELCNDLRNEFSVFFIINKYDRNELTKFYDDCSKDFETTNTLCSESNFFIYTEKVLNLITKLLNDYKIKHLVVYQSYDSKFVKKYDVDAIFGCFRVETTSVDKKIPKIPIDYVVEDNSTHYEC